MSSPFRGFKLFTIALSYASRKTRTSKGTIKCFNVGFVVVLPPQHFLISKIDFQTKPLNYYPRPTKPIARKLAYQYSEHRAFVSTCCPPTIFVIIARLSRSVDTLNISTVSLFNPHHSYQRVDRTAPPRSIMPTSNENVRKMALEPERERGRVVNLPTIEYTSFVHHSQRKARSSH